MKLYMKIILWILLTSFLCAQLLGGEPWWRRLDSAKANKNLEWWEKLPAKPSGGRGSTAKRARLELSGNGFGLPMPAPVDLALQLTPLQEPEETVVPIPPEESEIVLELSPTAKSEELACRPKVTSEDSSPKAELKPLHASNVGQGRLSFKTVQRFQSKVQLWPENKAETARHELVKHSQNIGENIGETRSWPKLVPQVTVLQGTEIGSEQKTDVGLPVEKQQKDFAVEVIDSGKNGHAHFCRYMTMKKRRLGLSRVNPRLGQKNLSPQTSLEQVLEQPDGIRVARSSLFSRLLPGLGFKPKKRQAHQKPVESPSLGKTTIPVDPRHKSLRHKRRLAFLSRGLAK